MTVRYVHYSEEPFTGPVIDASQEDGGRYLRGDKPNGLWFSVDGRGDTWADFCGDKEMFTPSLACRTEITFRRGAKILRLRTGTQLEAFSNKYQCVPPYRREINGKITDLLRKVLEREHCAIDWPRIAKRYDAIIIAPFLGAARFDHFWYYSWDCASGCVWNARAVAKLTLLTAEDDRDEQPKRHRRR